MSRLEKLLVTVLMTALVALWIALQYGDLPNEALLFRAALAICAALMVVGFRRWLKRAKSDD